METKAQKLNITSFPYREYDTNGNKTYYGNSEGYWNKRVYDTDGKVTYYEDNDGNWFDSSI